MFLAEMLSKRKGLDFGFLDQCFVVLKSHFQNQFIGHLISYLFSNHEWLEHKFIVVFQVFWQKGWKMFLDQCQNIAEINN